jgi:hypothetical protein
VHEDQAPAPRPEPQVRQSAHHGDRPIASFPVTG